jgi:hypothetical protein
MKVPICKQTLLTRGGRSFWHFFFIESVNDRPTYFVMLFPLFDGTIECIHDRYQNFLNGRQWQMKCRAVPLDLLWFSTVSFLTLVIYSLLMWFFRYFHVYFYLFRWRRCNLLQIIGSSSIKLHIRTMDSEWHPWIGSVAGSMLVGLSGIVPLLVFPDPSKLKNPSSATPLGKY